MTPEERALRDAFLAEMWPVVREYHEGDPLPRRPVHRRAERVNKAGDKADRKAS